MNTVTYHVKVKFKKPRSYSLRLKLATLLIALASRIGKIKLKYSIEQDK